MDVKETTDLVLLIGTNPLPNFITARYFLETVPDLRCIWLVYSESNKKQSGTHEFAYNIQQSLYKIRNININCVPLEDIENSRIIFNRINEFFLNKLKDDSVVHLNFTGGTKTMGIFVNQIIQNNIAEGRKQFSYLSPRDFRMISDTGDYLSNDLREIININLDELITLHNYERINKDIICYDNATKYFINLLSNNSVDKYFSGVYPAILNASNKNKIETVKKLEECFENLRKNKLVYSFLSEIHKDLSGECKILNDENEIIEGIQNDTVKNFFEFLDGKWLEIAIYNVLRNDSNFSNYKIYKNWEIKRTTWSKNKFELDVIIIYGYQLYCISCTTSSDKKECKQKGFEVFLRSKQIGGDEAKSVLITRLSDILKYSVKEELLSDTGSPKENIIVLGKSDLYKNRIISTINDYIK